MNEQNCIEVRVARQRMACAKAMGMLEMLLKMGHIPDRHVPQAAEIVAEYRRSFENAEAA